MNFLSIYNANNLISPPQSNIFSFCPKLITKCLLSCGGPVGGVASEVSGLWPFEKPIIYSKL